MSGRHWIGEAVTAFDQSLGSFREGDFPPPSFWVARAQAAAAIASAEQARIGNLIAWKQLQANRAATADQGVGMLALGSGDAIADEIEHALGIDEDPDPEPHDL